MTLRLLRGSVRRSVGVNRTEPRRRPMRGLVALLILICLFVAVSPPAANADDLEKAAPVALRKAIDFYRRQVASHGGYVYRYSADLTKREGEGKVGPDTVWVQPPGTPTVGEAYLEAHRQAGIPEALDAARETGLCLVRGQLRSGGWNQSIEFEPEARKKFAYRVEAAASKQFNVTTFDDDKTQSALRFLMRLDQALEFRDQTIHEAALFALDSILQAQRPNGGWPQGYDEFPKAADFPVQPARLPDDWPREYPGGKYWHHYTLNDNAQADTIDMLLLAGETYGEPKYRAAGLRGADFLLLAQLPEPQPGWAQQYDAQLQPAWARKFEPPAITGGESQGVLRVLLRAYAATGEGKYLEPLPRAIAYLRRSQLPNGQLARFYELRTNKPLFMTRDYQLTYDGSDTPTHYSFTIGNQLDAIERELRRLRDATPEERQAQTKKKSARKPGKPSPSLVAEARRLVDSLDERGAWVEEGKLRYHGKQDETRRIIDSQTFSKNLKQLSQYVGKTRTD